MLGRPFTEPDEGVLRHMLKALKASSAVLTPEDLMREISAIEGFVVASVVDPLTGTVLASAPRAGDESVQVTASGARSRCMPSRS